MAKNYNESIDMAEADERERKELSIMGMDEPENKALPDPKHPFKPPKTTSFVQLQAKIL